MKTKVLLVDGRKMLREGLSVLLEKHEDLHVAGDADDPRSAIKLLRPLAIDVVILNVGMPDHGIVETLRAIGAERAAVKIIVLLNRPTAPLVRQIVQAGASGCLSRESASVDLVAAIRAAMANELYLSPTIAKLLVSGMVLPGKKNLGIAELAPREREVIRRIADGQSTKEIAYALRVSTKTIETHRRRIMDKLGVRSVAELTKYAIAEGFTSLESPV